MAGIKFDTNDDFPVRFSHGGKGISVVQTDVQESDYYGPYTVTPTTSQQTLQTAHRSMTQNLVVEPIGSYEDLTDKPKVNSIELEGNVTLDDLGIDIPTNVSELTNDAGYITGYTETDPVFAESVAADITASDITAWNGKSDFSGSYEDLTDKPTLFSGDYDDLSNKPTLFSGDYDDLSNKPTLFSGNYNDLSNKPSLFSGDYGDLTNKPTIPSKVSDLTNDAGYITGYTETDPTVPSWAKASTKPTYTASEVGALPSSTVIPTKVSDLTNDSGYLTLSTLPIYQGVVQ